MKRSKITRRDKLKLSKLLATDLKGMSNKDIGVQIKVRGGKKARDIWREKHTSSMGQP